MILVLAILFIFIFLSIVIFEPYLDIAKVKGKYSVILWYTDTDGERDCITIIGG